MGTSLGVVMDPIETINVKKDSSLAMLLAAKAKGVKLYYMTDQDIFIENGQAIGAGCEIDVFDDNQKWFAKGQPQMINLGSLDAILMRKDPPFDNQFLYATHILEMASSQGALVINQPASLRDCNEKIFATHFSNCCPPHLVTSNPERLKAFHKQYQDVIFKPLDAMGGSQIFRLKPDESNLNVIIETLTKYGTISIMAQAFIPAIKNGDKRILLIDGQPIPFGLARIPAADDIRGNLAAGATNETRALTERDYWICEQVAPTLKTKGLFFVGLDVIGDFLTEINVTSPTCIREISLATNINIAEQFVDKLLEKIADHAKN